MCVSLVARGPDRTDTSWLVLGDYKSVLEVLPFPPDRSVSVLVPPREGHHSQGQSRPGVVVGPGRHPEVEQ